MNFVSVYVVVFFFSSQFHLHSDLYADREFLQINDIKIKFIFGNLEYTIVNLYEACSRFKLGLYSEK